MRETQQSISDWANTTFGPSGSDLRVWARTNEELAELLRLLTTDGFDWPKAAEEAADTLIVLCRLGVRVGANLDFRGQSVNLSLVGLGLNAHAWLHSVAKDLEIGNQGGAAASLVQVVAALCQIIRTLGRDPQAEIDRKMEINRAREWRLDGSGHGYHVKAGQS